LGNNAEYNPVKWRDYHDALLDFLSVKGAMSDYAFETEMLTDLESLGIDRQSLVNNPPFIKHDFEYNFFVPGYERAISGNFPETLLPNLYVLALLST